MERLSFTRGDTLELRGAVQSGDAPFDLTGYAGRSEVRRPGGALVDELEVTIVDAAAGSFVLARAAAATGRWPTGDCRCDIEFADASGRTFSSPPFTIDVQGGVTRG